MNTAINKEMMNTLIEKGWFEWKMEKRLVLTKKGESVAKDALDFGEKCATDSSFAEMVLK